MTESRRGFVKLEFPETNVSKNETDGIINNMISFLQPALERHRIEVIEKQPIQVIEEEDCECYFEQKTVPSYQQPNIVLHSDDFWKNRLETDVHAVPLSAIYFGNVQGNTYLSHWEVSFWNEIKERQKRVSRNPLFVIEVDFEFDKTDMITGKFQCTENVPVKDRAGSSNNNNNNNKYNKNNSSNGEKRTERRVVKYQLTIRRDSIRRIIVDPSVHDSQGARVRLHLELNAPPLIRKGMIDKEKESQPYHQPFYKRWKTFNKLHWKDYGWPDEKAISDSPYFSFDFMRDVSDHEIYRILCRLKARTRVSIEFAHYQIVEIPISKQTPYGRWAIQRTPDGRYAIKPPTDSNAAIFRDFLLDLFPPKYRTSVSWSRR